MSRKPWWLVAALVGASAAQAQDLHAGQLIYSDHCVICHGPKGKGDGPSSTFLDPKPTNFVTATPNEEEWFTAIKFGSKAAGKSNGMKSFQTKLTDAQIRDVLAYCKTLKK